MKRLITLILATIAIQSVFAATVKVQYGDLFYNLDTTTKTASVTYDTSSTPSSSSPAYSNFSNKSLTIPEKVVYSGEEYKVTSVGTYAFRYCSGLSSVSFPDGITEIGNYAFCNCTGLTSVSFPVGLTTIGKEAFSYCTGLTSVSFTDGITEIGSFAFYSCGNLNEVNIPSLEAWCNIKFGDYISNPNYYAKNLLINGEELSGVVKLPSDWSEVPEAQFAGCDEVTEFILPQFITSVGNYAFSYCSSLTSFSFPDGITEIGSGAFDHCSGLTSVSFPEGLIEIGSYAFDYCSGLTSVSFPDSLTAIGSWAFRNCNNIKEVNIPSFEAWCNIKFVNWGSNPNYYAKNLLINGKELSGVVKLPSDWSEVPTAQFAGCDAVTEFILPQSLTTIASNAFEKCSGLISVTFPEGITFIKMGAFQACSGLKEVNIPSLEAWCNIKFNGSDSNPNYYAKNLLINGEELSGVVKLPSDLTEVPEYQFYGCKAVKEFIFPEGLTEIGIYAFGNCSELRKVISLNPTPPKNYNNSFSTPAEGNVGVLYVPETSLQAYQTTSYWNEFQNIQPIVLASGLELSIEKNPLTVGYSQQITASLTPEDATVDQFSWSSSDESVATIDGLGIVTAIKAGTTTITAQTIDGSGVEATYELTVTDALGAFDIADFEINTNESIDIPVNLTSYTNEKYSAFQFDVTLPEGLQFENAELGEELIAAGFQIKTKAQSSGAIRVIVTPTNNLAGVDYTENLLYIKVKALNSAEPGIEDIQITNAYLSSVDGSDLCLDNSSASVIFKSTIKTISLDPQTQNIILGQSGTITATVKPVDAANRQLQWSVDDPTVVEISGNGLEATLKALKLGSVTVTAVSPYDATIKGEATVNVVGTLEINAEKSIIKTTETIQLTAAFVENDEITPKVTWSSSAPQYATVDSDTGMVTGVAVGTAIITATSTEYDNLSATIEVEVQEILLGDANDNGSVTVADVVTIANFIVKNPVANWCFINADVNKSGDITAADMTGTINIIAGEEISAASPARREAQMYCPDRLFSEDFKPVEGETFNIGVSLDNVIPYSALQASVIIPEGMTVESITAGSQASNHNMIYNITDDGHVEIVLFSLSNEPFYQNNNTLFNLLVTAEKNCGDLDIRNIIASDATAKDYNLAFEGGKNLGNTTGVESIGNGEPTVYAFSSGIEVINAGGMQINIFSVTGEMVASRLAMNSIERFNLDKGIYIVTINDRNYKLII